jgi:hypothetical protein
LELLIGRSSRYGQYVVVGNEINSNADNFSARHAPPKITIAIRTRLSAVATEEPEVEALKARFALPKGAKRTDQMNRRPPPIGTLIACLNLFREADGSVHITVFNATGAIIEYDALDNKGIRTPARLRRRLDRRSGGQHRQAPG